MKLLITSREVTKAPFDTFVVKHAQLTSVAFHIFLKSQRMWESISVEILPSMPPYGLEYLSHIGNSIEVSLPPEITEDAANLLFRLFPDESGNIRQHLAMNMSLDKVIPVFDITERLAANE